jgi:steroid delta-isomerase-like uncharacterized protein
MLSSAYKEANNMRTTIIRGSHGSRRAFLRQATGAGAMLGAGLFYHRTAHAEDSRCIEVGQSWLEFWNGRDLGRAFDVFTRDIVFEDVTLGVVNRGAEQFLAFAQGIFNVLPDAKFVLVSASCDGHEGLIEWIFSGTDANPGLHGTGKKFSVRGVSVVEIEGRRIARDSDYWDLATLLRQIGLLPTGL